MKENQADWAIKQEAVVDIFESESGFLIIMDMPGVGAADVRIQVEAPHLVVSGLHRPRCHGHDSRSVVYERMFEIADSIDQDGIEAAASRGVLRIFLPKNDRA
jgi:HSP20 family protein